MCRSLRSSAWCTPASCSIAWCASLAPSRERAKLAHHAIEQLAGVRHAELRSDRHIPVPRISECPAFYGILLGHEHGKLIRERHLACGKRVMVGERVLDDVEAACAQFPKETRRIADAGNGVQAPPSKLLERLWGPLTVEPPRLARDQSHLQRSGV